MRTRSSGRLIAVSRPAQPTTNVAVVGPSSRADPRRACSSASLHAGQVEAVGDDDEALGRCDAEADEVVAHLVADGDERLGRVGEQPLDPAEDALPARLK